MSKHQKDTPNNKNFRIHCSSVDTTLTHLVDKSQSRLPKWTPVTKISNVTRVKKIISAASGTVPTFLVWKGKNKLEFYQKNKPIKNFTIKKDTIKDICSGEITYLILTKSGKVYSLANYNRTNTHCEIPLSDPEKSTWNEIRSVPFFNQKKNNRKVKSIMMNKWSNYYLCEYGHLYANGFNEGALGDGTNNDNNNIPVFISENVTRVFGGVGSSCFLITNTHNELRGAGYSQGGKCGIGDYADYITPHLVPDWKADHILDIKICGDFTILITKEGKTFSTGFCGANGIGTNTLIFTEIPLLKKKKVIQIFGGIDIALALTDEMELYGWGFRKNSHPTDQYQKITDQPWNKPRKIDLPSFFQEKINRSTGIGIEMTCGYDDTILIYTKWKINSLLEDFQNLYKSKQFCNSSMHLNNKQIIPIHKTLIELRTNLSINKIEKILNKNDFKRQDIDFFLKWIYYGDQENEKILKSIFKSLHLSFSPDDKEHSLKKDLFRLFKDEDSKDFIIKVKIDDDDDDDDNEEEEEGEEGEGEERYENIPVHKLILIARSGLFREMFENNKEKQNIKKVNDYSGKSIESLEILIKYFYTNKIKLTADQDLELISEELNDVIEYYQLNENSNLIEKLKEK
ncbi:hypothetical protein M0812_05327 [Anaeramoeba flamelloides]|uniref:BTB domain-containing protein n=1 Tax=Anaeramoeba flamelloides TaxID=1746091 RepID=A0AAV8A8Q1_9EUKA|nr:hypothetical protein M0812_05327 [Anaeramoeba flamelloides]